MSYLTKYRDQEFGPFVVDDRTGTAYVDPEHADLVLSSGDEFAVDGGEDPPPFVREFVDRETDVDPVGRYRRRYKEYRIDVDEEVRVAGQTDPDAVRALDEPVTTVVSEAGAAPKFFVTDDADLGLGKRMLQETLVYFLAGAILLAISYFIVFL